MIDNIKDFLEFESTKDYFIKLQNILENEHNIIVPEKSNWYRAFEMDWKNIKVIILGQDPYYLESVADGLSFSTKSLKTPSSLKNIFKEIKANYPDATFETNDLEYWKRQGILLSNTVLTTTLNRPLAHQNIGWEIFVKNALQEILKLNKNIIFLCLGKKSLNFIKNFDLEEHFVLETSHPSGLSCYRGFIGSKIFSKTNNLLKLLNLQPIDWSVKKCL